MQANGDAVLRGNLKEFPLLNLLQTLLGAKRDGELYLEHPQVPARLSLRQGRLVSAAAGKLVGDDALELIAGMRYVPFRFEDGQAPVEENLFGGLAVQQRLAQLVEDWQQLELLSGDWGEVLRLKPRGKELQFSQDLVRLASLSNGQPIATIFLGAGMPPLEVARKLERLLELGVLEARPQVQVVRHKLIILPLYGTPQGVAFVDEDLYREWSSRVRPGLRLLLQVRNGPILSFQVRPRPNFAGRVGLCDPDLRKHRLARGLEVEAWFAPA
jgi:hypothetical protein